MLVVPTTFQRERGLLLAAMTLAAAILSFRRWILKEVTLLLWLMAISAGLFFIFLGHVRDAPGALNVATIFVIWPLLYLLAIGLASRRETIDGLTRVVQLGVMIAATMGLIVVVGFLTGRGELISRIFAFQNAAFGSFSGFVEFRLLNLTTLIYGFPFLTARLIWRTRHRHRRHNLIPETIGWTLVFVVSVLSGRRALWLVMAITPLLLISLFAVTGTRFNRLPAIGILLLIGMSVTILILMFDIDLSSVADQFSNAFDFEGEESASARGAQINALVQAWVEKPVFGYGHGAADESVIRNRETPWAYEITYLALLFQTGIVGFTIYVGIIVGIIVAGIRTVRREYESGRVLIPLLSGCIAIVIAAGTNPYFTKFDYLWVIFLPAIAVKVYGKRDEHRHSNS